MARVKIIGTLAPEDTPDGTPVNFNRVTERAPGKYEGTDGADKATLDTIARDKDGIVKLGAGADVFVFGVGDDSGGRLNGVVSMGDGGNDRVFLTHSLEDYTFTLRDGGIKVHYIGADSDGDGAAVTFYGAEQFVFRNIDPVTNENYQNTVLSYDQLRTVVADGTYNPDLFS